MNVYAYPYKCTTINEKRDHVFISKQKGIYRKV